MRFELRKRWSRSLGVVDGPIHDVMGCRSDTTGQLETTRSPPRLLLRTYHPHPVLIHETGPPFCGAGQEQDSKRPA
jgi:hypothetical protein